MLKNARTTMVVVMSLVLVCTAGCCKIFKRGPSDEELLKELLCTYETSMKEGDVEKLLSLYSEDYESERGDDYDTAAERLRGIVPRLQDMGLEISTDETEIEIDGKEGTIGPIHFEFSQGSIDITLFTTKEDDGCWRITGSKMQR